MQRLNSVFGVFSGGRICRLLSLSMGILLAGCGLRVPPIQEVGDRAEGQRFVDAVVSNINCELRGAFNDLRDTYPQGTFMDNWGAQTTLTLTYDETGALAPGALGTPAPLIGVFSIGGGLNLSSEAVRTETLNSYFLVSDLNKKRCSPEALPNGPFLLQSDLKLSEWLNDVYATSLMQTVNFNESVAAASNNNVVQHEVKFIITTSGTLNPSWKISTVTVNPSGNLLSLGRVRTNDLLITLGPAQQAVLALNKNGHKVVTVEPSRQAADLHLSSTIGNSISNALTNGLITNGAITNGFIIH
jgi:hypothetical protein